MGIVNNTVEDCGSVTTMVPAAMAVPDTAGTIKMRVGLMPWLPMIPARVQPEVPRQLVGRAGRSVGVEPKWLDVEGV